jgi:hypothetical protein
MSGSRCGGRASARPQLEARPVGELAGLADAVEERRGGELLVPAPPGPAVSVSACAAAISRSESSRGWSEGPSPSRIETSAFASKQKDLRDLTTGRL